MFNVTCLIKTDIDTVNKCMGQNPYNPETFLQNFASRLTSFDDPLLNIYPTSEIAGNIEDEDVILGLREPQKLIEWAKTMKERAQCMAMLSSVQHCRSIKQKASISQSRCIPACAPLKWIPTNLIFFATPLNCSTTIPTRNAVSCSKMATLGSAFRTTSS